MDWEAEILAFEPQPENRRGIQARARFFNPVTNEELFDRTWAFDLTYDRVVAWVKANIDVLNTRDTQLAVLQNKLGFVTIPEPKQSELDLAEFLEKAGVLARLKAQAENGIIDTNDAALATAQAEVKAAWKPEFSGKTPLG